MTNYRLSDYDRKRLEEMQRANLPLFWIGYAVIVFGVFALLMWTGWEMLTLSRSVTRAASGKEPLPPAFASWERAGIRFRRASV